MQKRQDLEHSFESFDGYTPASGADGDSPLPAPWVNDSLIPGPLISVTPVGAGWLSTLGAHGPSGGWWEAARPTNHDSGNSMLDVGDSALGVGR